MPRRELLTPAQREELLAFPTEEVDLIRNYTFSAHDLAVIRWCRGDHNRLGFSVQLCYLRFPGNFACALGKYCRDEKVISMPEAIRRLSALPATNLGLDRRGMLKEGMFADVVVFDPEAIADRATYENPHQYAIGMKHVFVNGVQVLKDGEHTGAKPGRALWGPGKVN